MIIISSIVVIMSKTISITQYLLGTKALLALCTGSFVMFNSIKSDNLNNKKEAENLIINFFIKYLEYDSEMSVDKAILKFENADEASLENFAKSKHRTRESYYRSYKKLFIEAKTQFNEKNNNISV